jgi:hypothetical protein
VSTPQSSSATGSDERQKQRLQELPLRGIGGRQQTECSICIRPGGRPDDQRGPQAGMAAHPPRGAVTECDTPVGGGSPVAGKWEAPAD